MKQVLFLLIIVIWGILQARRKAMREQQRKQAQPAAAPAATPRQRAMQQTRAQQAAPLGAVTAEENQTSVPERQDRSRLAPTIPEEIRSIVNETRRTKRKKREEQEQPEERVEEIVTPAASEQAYEITATAKRRIAFDPDSLRTFVVTREVLGPPRYRKPHRPGIRWR